MVHAHTLELTHLAVEEESLVRADLDGPETEACLHIILKLRAMLHTNLRSVHIPVCVNGASEIDRCAGMIKDRILRRPEHRRKYSNILLHLTV